MPKGRDTKLFKEYDTLIDLMQKSYSANESKHPVTKKKKGEDVTKKEA